MPVERGGILLISFAQQKLVREEEEKSKNIRYQALFRVHFH